MRLLDKIIIQAKTDIQTIVLPEGKDQRIIDAARILKNENILNEQKFKMNRNLKICFFERNQKITKNGKTKNTNHNCKPKCCQNLRLSKLFNQNGHKKML